mmetsp:Transcript_18759/g.33285  ORF Transcript_18759/g.33285 Transcript_18759/m.33285 type:complete len:220 (+) Transcript_18759:147-806(+)
MPELHAIVQSQGRTITRSQPRVDEKGVYEVDVPVFPVRGKNLCPDTRNIALDEWEHGSVVLLRITATFLQYLGFHLLQCQGPTLNTRERIRHHVSISHGPTNSLDELGCSRFGHRRLPPHATSQVIVKSTQFFSFEWLGTHTLHEKGSKLLWVARNLIELAPPQDSSKTPQSPGRESTLGVFLLVPYRASGTGVWDFAFPFLIPVFRPTVFFFVIVTSN